VEGYQVISDQIREAIVALRDRKKLRAKKTNGIELTPIFESLSDKFATSQVDAKVSFYFSLGDLDDHKWTITVDPDKCNVSMGKPQNGKADCVVKTSPEIFRKMIEESYVPSFDEFMNGTIKTNDPNLLMRFQAVFQLF
jgi:long-chain acyl-CoA synthetase